jgi:hypothetical protein
VNKTNSFADLLLAKGYTVYNTGIGGTDPPQYLGVAREYIPKLKPDFVIVNFNLDNDVQYYERKLKPFVPPVWISNSVYLLSCPNGVYFKDPQESFQFNREYVYIPPANKFNRLCSKTVITTLFWRAFRYVLGFETQSDMMKEYQKKIKPMAAVPYSNAQITEIEEICKTCHSQFVLVTLPAVGMNAKGNYQPQYADSFPNLFSGMHYFAPPVTKECYNLPDQHFNDIGHKKYADFLEKIIDSISTGSNR